MDLKSYIIWFVGFLDIIIQFLLAFAFFVFVYNAVRYFVIGSGNEESREKAKSLALYGVVAFVVILVFWGAVNLLADSLGFTGLGIPSDIPQSDYVNPDYSPPNCDPDGNPFDPSNNAC